MIRVFGFGWVGIGLRSGRGGVRRRRGGGAGMGMGGMLAGGLKGSRGGKICDHFFSGEGNGESVCGRDVMRRMMREVLYHRAVSRRRRSRFVGWMDGRVGERTDGGRDVLAHFINEYEEHQHHCKRVRVELARGRHVVYQSDNDHRVAVVFLRAVGLS